MADSTGAERSTAANTPKGQAGEELLSAQEAAECLLSMENIAILCHQYPDGDTLGSGYGLCRALRRLGKRAQVFCSDTPGERYAYLWEGLRHYTKG